MKLLLASILSIILVAGIGSAYAEISTDKDIYMMKDTVIVTGSVDIPNGNDPVIVIDIIDSQNNRMDSEALTRDEIFTEEFHIDPDFWTVDKYTVRVTFVEDEYDYDYYGNLQPTGERVRLGDFEYTVSFQVTTSIPEPITICSDGNVLREDGVCISEVPTDNTPTIQDKIKDLNEAEERIKELENRVMELENEKTEVEKLNQELNKQIDFLEEQVEFLQGELENVSQQFTDSVMQLNEWFVGKVTELQN